MPEIAIITDSGCDVPKAILDEYAIDWAHQNGIHVAVNVQGSDELPLEVEQGLFRIMQEALANIARHSSATSAAVNLSHDTDAVRLSIADDGRGFYY